MGVLGGCWGFLTGVLEDSLILDVMDVLVRRQGSYPESFVLLSLFFGRDIRVCYHGNKNVTYRHTYRHTYIHSAKLYKMIILDIMDDLVRP